MAAVDWLNDENGNNTDTENKITDPGKYNLTPGPGKVLVHGRGSAKRKFKKQIALSARIKERLDKTIVGSQVLGIEVLLDYALDQLSKNDTNLEI